MLLACLSVAAPGRAEVRRFETVVAEATVMAGEPFDVALFLETDGEGPDAPPTPPDWGGLTVVQGPTRTQQVRIVGGRQQLWTYDRYTLVGDRAGEFEIGPSTIAVQGRTFTSDPLRITVKPQDLSALPEELRDKPILHPQTDEPSITQQLRGRAFVLPVVSNSEPYVGEPFTLAYHFYQDRLPRPVNLQMDSPRHDTMLAEEPYRAQTIMPTEIVTIGGRDYDVTVLYRSTLTPTRPGTFNIDGFTTEFRLPVQSPSRRRSPRSPFDAFFDLDPAFSPMVTVEARGAPVEINVRAVPTAGRPDDFLGTVGDFTLASEVDRRTASEDDLITLSVRIEGEGNPALVAAPVLPDSNDFEVFDSSESVEKRSGRGPLAGSKTVEFLLRPKRAGTLRVPAFSYPIFNPSTGEFFELTSPSHTVQVAPGRASTVASGSDEPVQALPELSRDLDYIKPLLGLRAAGPPAPLLGSPFFWAVQAGALLLAAAAAVRADRRRRIDPAEERRRQSWTALDLRLKRIEKLSGPRAAEEAAQGLERALREFIADWFNLKADGLTAPEISFRLMGAGLSKEAIKRIEDIMEECARVRYAPAGENIADFTDWADEAREILSEGLHS
jgi:hypothetical protein